MQIKPINRGIKAAEATGIPSGTLPAGSFGISTIQRTPPQVSQATLLNLQKKQQPLRLVGLLM